MPTDEGGRGLDHLVIGVHDLDAAGAFYERLGFKVGSRNRHPWGTHNRIVQFPGSFLELITVGDAALIPDHAPGRFSFGAFVRDALARGQGMSMLVLESIDAAADKARFDQAGIGGFETFFFERQARRPDGSEVRVAFTLAFAADPLLPQCGFFVCQQHEPQNFWNPAFQRHANGAARLKAVSLVVDEPEDHAGFLRAFGGAGLVRDEAGGLSSWLPRGRIDVIRRDDEAARSGSDPGVAGFAGFTVTVADQDALATRLAEAGIRHDRHHGTIIVPAAEAFGVAIAFEAA